jgi:hypothetical protein
MENMAADGKPNSEINEFYQSKRQEIEAKICEPFCL